jgi:Fur family transcriptional regulator, ferric uptake regulator
MGAAEVLKKHGLKKTTPRVSIINVLTSAKHPMSESEIKIRMGDLYDRVTFYRNVQSFINAGVMHKIIVDNRRVRYALNCIERHNQFSSSHAHFICRVCEKIVCLDQVEKFAYTLPPGFTREECDVMVKGLCDQCSVFS